MKKEQPILSCAGREAVSIDAALLNELLISFTPTTIGIRQKAQDVSERLRYVADGCCDNALEEFKNIITTEFLSSKLARQSTAVTVDVSDPDYGNF
jgi:hypothetical protein